MNTHHFIYTERFELDSLVVIALSILSLFMVFPFSLTSPLYSPPHGFRHLWGLGVTTRRSVIIARYFWLQ